MKKKHSMTHAERKAALLARGEPVVVHPEEVAKCTAAYESDPEILLGCIVVSGTLDTAAVLTTETRLAHGIAVAADELAVYQAFRRVWSKPTDDELAEMVEWARRIAGGGSPCAQGVAVDNAGRRRRHKTDGVRED